MSEQNEKKAPQSKTIMALVCFFLGGLGIHRFVMGHIGIGVLMLLTGGVCGILALIDFVRILTGSLKMKDGQDLV
jgi:TM2 domain-containing membrane protein YozV